MRNTPIERKLIDETIEAFQIADFGKATIREVKAIAAKAEVESGIEFIKMEMGVPGLPPSAVGVKAEIEALQRGIASLYPDINGLSALKEEASRFIKAFINVDLKPEGCVPVTGSMQGTFASFLTCSQCDEKKDTILFIDPGFPVQKQQLVVMGQKFETFDVYDFRGDKLKEKLESYLEKGNISAIVYSNPNNPSWICLKEEELHIIGELATKYDVIVLVDCRYGGKVLSQTQADMDLYGVSEVTAQARDEGYVMLEGHRIDNVKGFYKIVGGRAGTTEYYMYDATNIRLRELSLSYQLPASWMEKSKVLKKVQLSFIARNLFFFYKKAPFDPDLVLSTGNDNQGIDVYGMPTTRSWGFSLKCEF